MENDSPVSSPRSPKLHLKLGFEAFHSLGVMPWFSYTVTLPARPLPSIAERPHIKTKRLVIRPILPADLDAFYELRRCAETQEHSKTRGRPDRSKEETQQTIEALNEDEQNHWYFGVFLQSTGEMIGEGGLPDCNTMSTSNSGWPEAEFLIKPQYWRQGYGTEMFDAIVNSWWKLPREKRRHQLIPALAPGKEPGDEVAESIVFQWEDSNVQAREFFAKMLAGTPAAADGEFESCDTREGREGNIVQWFGTVARNPNRKR